MRKKLSQTLLLFALTFIMTNNVFAAGWLSSGTITSLKFMDEGLLIFADGWNDPNNCAATGVGLLPKTDPNYDKAYALVLSAYMSGKKITGYSDGCVNVDGTMYNSIRGHKYFSIE